MKSKKFEVGNPGTIRWHGPNKCKHIWVWLSESRPKKKASTSKLAPTKWCGECGSLNQYVLHKDVVKVQKRKVKKYTGRKWFKVLPLWGYGISTIEINWTEGVTKKLTSPKKVS